MYQRQLELSANEQCTSITKSLKKDKTQLNDMRRFQGEVDA